MIDSHVHSDFSPDSTRSMREVCKLAMENNVDRLCFTNHFTVQSADFDWYGTFNSKRFDAETDSGVLTGPLVMQPGKEEWRKHYEDFQAVKEEFPDLQLAFGIEADYSPLLLVEIKGVLDSLPFDFILGSTHYLRNYCISVRDGCEKYLQEYSLEDYFAHYFETERSAAASGWFDSLAHLDYCLSWLAACKRAVAFSEYGEFAFKAIDEMARAKTAIEINSGGWRKAIGRAYPALELLEYAAQVGVPGVTLGSDAHKPGEYFFKLREAVELAITAGFENALFFMNREPEEIPLSTLI
ncbi:MAG: histidinol-phosphatase HisJ family protein [Candidatus Micrarchaeota archaeon]